MVTKTKVFISYSRRNREQVQIIYDALSGRGDLKVTRDTDDILPSEEWKTRLESLILESDVVIFALSPESAQSDVCAWELKTAEKFNKKIIPVVIEEVEGHVPDAISKLNYVFLTTQNETSNALSAIQKAIELDIVWIREHTRLGELANRWKKSGKPNFQALRGKELEAAEEWLIVKPPKSPQLTNEHQNFISHSRHISNRRRNMLTFSMISISIFLLGLAIFSYVQRNDAIAARVLAQSAERQAIEQRDLAFTNEARHLAAVSTQRLGEGYGGDAISISLRGLPQTPNDVRPIDMRLLRSLWAALSERKELAYFPQDNNDFRSVSDDGRSVVLAHGYSSGLQVRNNSEFQEAIFLEGSVGSWEHAIFSPNSAYVLAGSHGGRIAIWNAENGHIVAEFNQLVELGNWISAVEFLDNERFVIGANRNPLYVGAISETSKIRIAENSQNPPISYFDIQKVNEHYIVVSDYLLDGGRLRLVNLDNGNSTLIGNQCENSPIQISYHEEADILVSVCDGREMSFWNLRDAEMHSLREPEFVDARITTLVFSADGSRIFVGTQDKERPLLSIDVINQRPIDVFEGLEGAVYSLFISNDGHRLLSGSGDGSIVIWDANSGIELSTMRGHNGSISAVYFDDADRVISYSAVDGYRFWTSGVTTRRTRVSRDGFMAWVIASRNAVFMEGGDQNSIIDFETLQIVAQLPTSFRYFSTYVSPDLGSIFGISSAGDLLQLDLNEASPTAFAVLLPERETENEYGSHRMHYVRFHENSKWALAGGSDGTWYMNLDNAEATRKLPGLDFELFGGDSESRYPPQFVTFDGDTVILFGTRPGTLVAWDMLNDRAVFRLSGHMARVTTVLVLPDGTLLSGDENGEICRWSMQTPPRSNCLSLVGNINSVIRLNNGSYIALTSKHLVNFTLTSDSLSIEETWDSRVELTGCRDCLHALPHPTSFALNELSSGYSIWDIDMGGMIHDADNFSLLGVRATDHSLITRERNGRSLPGSTFLNIENGIFDSSDAIASSVQLDASLMPLSQSEKCRFNLIDGC